jgi:HTH-type transcriptional regulator / antitoxin HigA
MKNNKIETREDYEIALGRIRELWRADPETPEGKELDELIDLVTLYEKRFV